MSDKPISTLTAEGLNTTANPIGVSRGTARVADNCVVRSKDVWESRRGQAFSSSTFGSIYDRARAVAFYDGHAIYQCGDSGLWVENSSDVFVQLSGACAPPAPEEQRTKFVEANGKLYFTTSSGIQALDNTAGGLITACVPAMSGIPKPYNVEVRSFLLDAGSSTKNWLADNNQISIRAVFCKRDAQGNVQEGPPSEPCILVNDSGAGRAIFWFAGAPAGITAAHSVRIYMTDPSGSETLPPGDEHFLCYERQIAQSEIDAGGSIVGTITNIEAVTSDVPLYTNPNTGNGIEAAKYPAPWAKDITSWAGSLWAFGVRRKHRFRLTLLGVDPSSAGGTGLDPVDNPNVFINGKTYHFNGTYPNPFTTGGAGYIPIGTTAAETAFDFVSVINELDPAVRAYYVPAADGWPGEIVIEEAGVGGDAFTVYGDANSSQAFYPVLPVTSGAALSSTADAHGNVAWFTPVDEPEAWPLGNFIPVGKRGSNILRGKALKDRLYLFMDDGTVQVISGGGGQFRVDELDSSAQLIGPDTVCVANNQIWCFTTQGFVTVSEVGVGVVGLPVEADTRMLLAPVLETTKLVSFGFGYESERMVGIWVPTNAGQTVAQAGYIYNYFSKAWTRWPMARTCGAVSPYVSDAGDDGFPVDTLHMGDGDSNHARIERKSLTAEDFADETLPLSLADYSGTTVVLLSTAGISVGDVLRFGDTARAVVTEVTDATHVEVSNEAEFDDPLTVCKSFPCELQWATVTGGAPGLEKDMEEMTLHMDGAFHRAEVTLTTEKSEEQGVVKIITRPGYGSGAWGDFPWGESSGPFNARGVAPMDKNSGAYLNPRFYIREAFASWKVYGYTMEIDGGSERTRR